MRLLPILILAVTFFAVGAAPTIPLPTPSPKIVLFDKGLTCSKIHSEQVLWSEGGVIGGRPYDAAGNYYTIQNDFDAENPRSARIIQKYTVSGSESLFALLDVPNGQWGSFEAIGFDRGGNMIVAVCSASEEAYPTITTRDYYRIEGMPKSRVGRRLAFLVVSALLIVMLILSFQGFSHSVFRRGHPSA